MFKNDGPKVWVNRGLSFVVGGLVVLVVMSIAAVAPVKSENAALTTQLDELQNGATRLLSEAKAYTANGSYSNAQQALSTLYAEHPGSSEAVEGKQLGAEIAAILEASDLRWEASLDAVRSAWEKDTAAKLRAEADAVRQRLEVTLADTLATQWEQSKDRVRKDWENGEI